ncbi:MAG: PilZ domain [Myxococcaceae bacterium]|nr:PilZ domain [Myxococcaceae bacterium]
MALSVHSGELRRHVRVEFQGRAWCEHRDWTLYLPIVNVSCDGLFIQTSTPFARGELLRVCLTDRNPLVVPLIELEAEVRWSSSRGKSIGVGCRILDFAQGADRYAELVEQLALLGR